MHFVHIGNAQGMIGKKFTAPFIGLEKILKNADPPQWQKGSDLGCRVNIFFPDFQRVFVYIVVHAEPVLSVEKERKLFKAVHHGSCQPKPVPGGNDKKIDVRGFIRKVFGKGTGDRNTLYKRKDGEKG